MRLNSTERNVIREAVLRHFGPTAIVRVFGSRADDAARGGDIDLYLDDVAGSADVIVRARIALLTELHERLGDQHIDVVIRRKGGPRLPIHRRAEATGVPV